jgi:hypothetical protein
MASPGYTKLFEVATRLKRSQPCVLGYIKKGKLAAEKGADGHWYISDTSLDAFIAQRDLAEGARALTAVDILAARVEALERRTNNFLLLEERVEKLTAGMKVMLAHMKKGE